MFSLDGAAGLGLGAMLGLRDGTFYQSLNHSLAASASSFLTSRSTAVLAWPWTTPPASTGKSGLPKRARTETPQLTYLIPELCGPWGLSGGMKGHVG